MKRREFITLLGGAAATWPLEARAQQPATPVVGYLSARTPQDSVEVLAEFHPGLAEMGFVEGRNVAIEYGWIEGHYDRIPEMIADLVRRGVAVIAIPNTTRRRLPLSPVWMPITPKRGSLFTRRLTPQGRWNCPRFYFG